MAWKPGTPLPTTGQRAQESEQFWKILRRRNQEAQQLREQGAPGTVAHVNGGLGGGGGRRVLSDSSVQKAFSRLGMLGARAVTGMDSQISGAGAGGAQDACAHRCGLDAHSPAQLPEELGRREERPEGGRRGEGGGRGVGDSRGARGPGVWEGPNGARPAAPQLAQTRQASSCALEEGAGPPLPARLLLGLGGPRLRQQRFWGLGPQRRPRPLQRPAPAKERAAGGPGRTLTAPGQARPSLQVQAGALP
ncbi:hypothetical protein GH733_006540 [Mirounga leonina]|nr:hypothetical protein GH733_006540 [Mirounga leonina]